MSKIIVNKKPCLRTLADGTKLEPGANLVSDDVVAKALAVEHTKILFTKGILVLKEVPQAVESFTPGNFIESTGTLKVADALKAIAACESQDALKTWMDSEARKTVRDAITKRHEALADRLEDPEVENTDED